MAKPNMDDYEEVSVRLVKFFARFPEGSIQAGKPCEVQVGGQDFIEVTASAYRTPDDPRPAVATAREPFPGSSNFTRGSEQMNAETSAIGRALVNLGFGTKASLEEVRNRVEEQEAVKRGAAIDGARVRKIGAAWSLAAPADANEKAKFEQATKLWLVGQGVPCDTEQNIGQIVPALSKKHADLLEGYLRERAPKAEA